MTPRGGTIRTVRAVARTPRAPILGGSRRLVPPPEVLAFGAVLALASVNLLGPLGVLMFMAGSAALVAAQPSYNMRALLRFAPLLILPALAILSTIWSDAPQRTMRAGLQLMLTFAAAIVICRNLRPERLILALFIAFLAIALTILPFVPQSLASKQALVGNLGSKNQVGFVAYMLVALALGVVFDRSQPLLARIAAAPAMGYALLLGMLAQSGGTTTSILLTLIVFPPMAILAAMKLPVRIVLLGFVLLLVAVCAFFLADIEAAAADFRVNVLKKDATLTGRTYLWDVAAQLAERRPMLGYGYFSFWRQGNIDAEGLWRWGGIASRSGFNFHNQFVEMRVDLGMIGLAVLIALCVMIALAAVIRQITAPGIARACLIGVMVINYFRAFVEDGLVAPFSLITLIWLATGIYAVTAAAGTAASARTRSRRWALGAPPVPRRDTQRGERFAVTGMSVQEPQTRP